MAKDSLSADTIKRGLETRFIGQRVLYHPSVTSTMEIARREARQGAAEGTLVVAGEQTVGRGRSKHVWLTPEGNIALSLILHPGLSCLPSLIMLASLAVARSIERVTGLSPQVKWPNDILINGKKVCGILIESDVQGSTVNYTIIGIGINVNLKPADFAEIREIATSLSYELGQEVSYLSMLRCLLTELESLYLLLLSGGSLYEEWRAKLVTLGKKVRVISGDTVQEGIAEEVTRDGGLLLRRPDGEFTRIVAGETSSID
ncbi:MAG: biotin--[acetyl-CoA-carboxylase] ligase [Dehalococcoidales bacterium]|nr:biotin--[acetyl-CoA-carboxylase] ligase [Dehalococcoidales bacterium]